MNNSFLDIFTAFIISFLIIFVFVIRYYIIILIFKTVIQTIRNAKSKKIQQYFKSSVVSNSTMYKDVTKNELQIFNTDDLDGLKDKFYSLFLKFENAYNNLDYSLMKTLSTNQLYQNYYTGISLDLENGKKRIIDEIEKKKVIIYSIDSTIAKQTVSAMIEISYLNYVINKDGYIVSGNRKSKITERFEVVFRKDFNREKIKNCPNCGANISGNKCEFCRTIIDNEEFKISSIKRIEKK